MRLTNKIQSDNLHKRLEGYRKEMKRTDVSASMNPAFEAMSYVGHHELVYEKLGQLEDIEEKIGCPFEVFFKAIFQDYVYVKLPNGSIDESDFSPQLSYDRDCLYFTIVYDDDFICYNLVDYGKTWALTKEELL